MRKYNEKISDNSVWITATPTELARTLPFYVTEAGHFTAERDYMVQRETHDSFLMMYTIKGQGFLQTGDIKLQMQQNDAVIIDCHSPHKYYSLSDEWEFLWIHLNGMSVSTMFHIIYPSDVVSAIQIQNPYEFKYRMKELVDCADRNDISGHTDISLRLHSLMNTICASALDRISKQKSSDNDIRSAVNFIEFHYSEQITIEDMIKNIHVSKYHFIRLFRRIMGITPYQYLTNYRINMSKTLLRTTSETVSEIAEACGFLDTSNFITQFKKHTGQKPLQYRRDFS